MSYHRRNPCRQAYYPDSGSAYGDMPYSAGSTLSGAGYMPSSSRGAPPNSGGITSGYGTTVPGPKDHPSGMHGMEHPYWRHLSGMEHSPSPAGMTGGAGRAFMYVPDEDENDESWPPGMTGAASHPYAGMAPTSGANQRRREVDLEDLPPHLAGSIMQRHGLPKKRTWVGKLTQGIVGFDPFAATTTKVRIGDPAHSERAKYILEERERYLKEKFMHSAAASGLAGYKLMSPEEQAAMDQKWAAAMQEYEVLKAQLEGAGQGVPRAPGTE